MSSDVARTKDNGLVEIEKVKTADSSSQDIPHAENKLTFQFFMTMLGLCMAFIVAEVIPLFLVTCFTLIAYDLDAIERVVWILVAPYIATGAVAPFVGNISDLIGRKGVMLVSLGMTVVGMVLCGAARNYEMFLAGITITGASIGMQLLTTIAAASELVPVSKRGATIGYIVIGFMPFAPASLYGQLLAEYSWRYIFVVIGVWAALSFIVLSIWYKPPNPVALTTLGKRQLLKQIDYVGCLLSVLSVCLFLIGINWGGADYPWNSPQVIGMLAGGLGVGVVFLLWEKFGTKHPMFPMRLIQSKRHFIGIAILCFTSGINYVPLTVFWTIQNYTVYQADFSQAGINLLPLGFCIAGGAILAAIAMTVWKRHVQWILLVCCIVQTVGIGCMTLADPDNINTVWAPMIFGLLGVGAVLLPSQIVFSVISPDDLIGTSIALSVVIRMIGQVIGKSMFYNIFRNRVTREATNRILVPALLAGFAPDQARLKFLVTTMSAGPLSHYLDAFPEINTPEELATIVAAGKAIYQEAFPQLYLISIPFGAVACLSCLLLFGISRYIDEHVAVLLH